MKSLFLRSLVLMALLASCLGFGAAQTVSNDLLQTGSGTQEDLSSLGLGKVTFQGVPLSSDTGPADTIVQHAVIPITGGTVSTQVIALHLMNSTSVMCGNEMLCGSSLNQPVEVHATINVLSATNGNITLPQPDALNPSTGTMTVTPVTPPNPPTSFTFNSTFNNIQADIIVVAVGAGVNGTPIFTAPGPAASMSANGGTMSTTKPFAYPNSQNFPTVAPYVTLLAGGSAAFLMGPGGKVLFGSLWGIGCLCLGLALWTTVHRSLQQRRIGLRPAYLTLLALAAVFTAWKLPSLSHPTIVLAEHCPMFKCNPISAEEGELIQHGVAPAATQCQLVPCPFQFDAQHSNAASSETNNH